MCIANSPDQKLASQTERYTGQETQLRLRLSQAGLIPHCIRVALRRAPIFWHKTAYLLARSLEKGEPFFRIRGALLYGLPFLAKNLAGSAGGFPHRDDRSDRLAGRPEYRVRLSIRISASAGWR